MDNEKRYELAKRLVEREVLACQSGLVSELMAESRPGFVSWEDIENLYLDPYSMTAEQCREWLEERGVDYSDAKDDEAFGADVYPHESLAELVNNHAEPAEIYEWWLITGWFADKLRAKGECVLDNGYGVWWGRQCTGQAIALDTVIEDIAWELWG